MDKAVKLAIELVQLVRGGDVLAQWKRVLQIVAEIIIALLPLAPEPETGGGGIVFGESLVGGDSIEELAAMLESELCQAAGVSSLDEIGDEQTTAFAVNPLVLAILTRLVKKLLEELLG